MQNCPSCKTECVEEAKFCHICGKPLDSNEYSTHEERKTEVDQDPRANLERLMPKEYLDRLRNSKGKIEGERRVVTILFSDVKGSTSMAENLDPEEVLEIMNGAFDILIAPITKYGGTLARLMGDAILAFFGAPIAHDDDPYLACRAALDILSGAEKYSKRLKDERGIEGFGVRVGINTGLVVVAEVGADLRVEYTAMGDAVNIAARMESAAEPNTILITEATQKLIKDKFDFKSVGAISVKGKAEPLNVYRVLSLLSDKNEKLGKTKQQGKIIGRKKEILELKNSIEYLKNGSGKIISLIGEQGLGKSRVVEEVKMLTSKNHRWIEGRAYDYMQKDSYWLARDLLNNLLELHKGSELESNEKLAAFMSIMDKEKLQDVYPFLTYFLNISSENDSTQSLRNYDPESLRGQIHYAYKEAFKTSLQSQPLIVLLEDLQWGDKASLQLMEDLFELVERFPILFVLVFRNDQGDIWELHNSFINSKNDYYTPITINHLNKKESLLYVKSYFPNNGLPTELENKILEKTEGNPFFIQELVLSLLDNINTNSTKHKLDISQIDKAFEIPNLLQSVILSRVDNLTPLDKSILQTASVIGKKISKPLLQDILNEELPHDEFERELNQLLDKKFILKILSEKEQSGLFSEEIDLVFKNSLIQEVVYDTLLQSRCRRLHNKIGESIEKHYQNSPDEYALTIAFHFEKGKTGDKAIKYYIIAGNRSKNIFANEEAIYSFTKAIELSEKYNFTESEIMKVHEALGDVYTLTSEYKLAVDQYHFILRANIKRLFKSTIAYKIAQVYERWGKYEEALNYFNESLNQVDENLETKHAAIIYAGIGMVRYRQDRIEEAKRLNIKSLELLNKSSEISHTADIYNNLGIIYSREQNLEKALELHRKCYQIKRKSGHISGLAASHNNLGYLYHQMGNFDKAIEHYKKSLTLCERTGNLHGLARVYDNISHVYLYQNMNEQAQEYNVKAIVALGKVALKGNEVSHDIWLQSGVW